MFYIALWTWIHFHVRTSFSDFSRTSEKRWGIWRTTTTNSIARKFASSAWQSTDSLPPPSGKSKRQTILRKCLIYSDRILFFHILIKYYYLNILKRSSAKTNFIVENDRVIPNVIAEAKSEGQSCVRFDSDSSFITIDIEKLGEQLNISSEKVET